METAALLLSGAVSAADEPGHWSEVLHPYLGPIALVISSLGVVVITWGVLRAAVVLVTMEIRSLRGPAPAKDRSGLRMNLGYYLLLGLEFLVAGDIVETLMTPDWQHVTTLGGLVLIRTVISVSLNWELGRERDGAEGEPGA
jgi:uncharacterized membrane protein